MNVIPNEYFILKELKFETFIYLLFFTDMKCIGSNVITILVKIFHYFSVNPTCNVSHSNIKISLKKKKKNLSLLFVFLYFIMKFY